MASIIILDTETTGLKVEDGHRIIEVGCVEIHDRRVSGRSLHHLINPEREVDAGATQVHGFTLADLEDKPRFAEIADEFLAFVRGNAVVIHNAAFDVGFLNMELDRIGRPQIQTVAAEVIDSLRMARDLFPAQRNSLDALCDRFGISNAHRRFHGALLDAELLAEVYLAMTRGQESLSMLADDPGPLGLASGEEARPWGALRRAQPSAEELEAHAAMLASMARSGKPPLWQLANEGQKTAEFGL